jgi:hypothetical protein
MSIPGELGGIQGEKFKTLFGSISFGLSAFEAKTQPARYNCGFIQNAIGETAAASLARMTSSERS